MRLSATDGVRTFDWHDQERHIKKEDRAAAKRTLKADGSSLLDGR